MIRFQDGQNRIEMPEIDTCGGFRNIRPSSEISKTEALDFWDDLFVNPEQKQEDFETALLQDVYGRDEDDFTFDVNSDTAEVKQALDRFQTERWKELSTEEKIGAISELGEEIAKILELSKIPNIKYYEGHPCDCGYYDAEDNSVWVNTNNFDDPQEIVDTVAHEMRHAYQLERAMKLETYEDFLYAYNFANYISPLMTEDGYVNFTDYQDQLIEAEARAFAKLFVVKEEDGTYE